MGVAPTEPLSNITAKLAFEFYVVKTVFFAVFHAALYAIARAFCAYEILFLELLLIFFLIHLAVFKPSKVWIFTCKAFIVSELEEAIIFEFIVVTITRVFELGMLIEPFMFASLNGLNFQVIFVFIGPIKYFRYLWAVRSINASLARGAVQEVEHDAGA